MINSHNNHTNYTEKMDRRHCQDYVQSLEEERRKIQVFSRELPLCLELITQAIEAYKQQSAGTTTTEYNLNGQPECSEQTSSDVPVLEEFIPLKRITSSDEDDDDEHESHKSSDCNSSKNNDNKASKKSDWLRSVQLWNQTPDPIPNEESSPRKVSVTEVKRNVSGGAFHPFKKENTSPATESPPDRSDTVAAASSTAENGGGSKKESESQRKQRRCWSAELHRRFLQALQQLGGSHVATPKQIRDLMKVDGLTNDEVKSHLQKYRLHTRRPSSSIHNNNQRSPQFVVVGGIWVPPPPEYSTPSASRGEASGVAHSNGIYAPIAAVPAPPQERRNHSDGGVHSNSPATSSSTHTTIASPTYS